MNRKKPWLAFLLSFLLCGAGLAYLGLWKWALVNFVVVVAVGVTAMKYFPDSISVISTACAAGSGSLAMQAAKQRKTP